MSTVGDLFTRQWVCQARVFSSMECSEAEPSTKLSHEGCGWRYEARFLPEDFEGIKDFELVRPENNQPTEDPGGKRCTECHQRQDHNHTKGCSNPGTYT